MPSKNTPEPPFRETLREEFSVRIYRPLQVLPDSGPPLRVATPVYLFGPRGKKQLDDFAAADSARWSYAEARKRTPYLLTPEGMRPAAGFPSPEELTLAIYQEIAPPQLREALFRLGMRWDRVPVPVTRRWWTRYLSRNRKLNVARELRRGRRAHWVLAACFPRSLRKRRRFHAQAAERDQVLATRLPAGESLASLWKQLGRSVLRLVAFRRSYLTCRFALFAIRFAAQTEFGEDFFRRLARALEKAGEFSRRDQVNAERWELCLRVVSFYDRDPARREPYHVMRKLILKAIENFEFLRHRRRPASGSMRKWLDRNGW